MPAVLVVGGFVSFLTPLALQASSCKLPCALHVTADCGCRQLQPLPHKVQRSREEGDYLYLKRFGLQWATWKATVAEHPEFRWSLKRLSSTSGAVISGSRFQSHLQLSAKHSKRRVLHPGDFALRRRRRSAAARIFHDYGALPELRIFASATRKPSVDRFMGHSSTSHSKHFMTLAERARGNRARIIARETQHERNDKLRL